jgi:hypothetical protein
MFDYEYKEYNYDDNSIKAISLFANISAYAKDSVEFISLNLDK